ncbi:phosphate ABC transporter substrate-binding protein [Anaerolactibacter massiliensis]|uniref:phosphate ABC transporter substrate-binding protein n=1 Tax=Anaerolactibacter massiliensis TaxID=2044573 RepID=UPI001EFE81AF|nr:phosphate ABC transporter substrate-binding protein [Anaerolactibacter massiliensis]
MVSMKTLTAGVLAAVMLAGCGSSSSSAAATSAAAAAESTAAAETSAAAADADLSGTVSTDGSTSMEKVIGALSEAFQEKYPNVTVTYNPTGSGSGITAVTEGNCDIGLASRNLKDEEKNGLTSTTVAIDGIAMIVNTANEVSDLSLDQIAKIYTGEITNWKDVGGADQEIVVIGREAGSGTRDGFESITGTSDKCQMDQELTSTGAVIQAVGANEAAIGYASLAAVDDTIKTLTVEGAAPSEETVLDGTYKIQRNFNMITNDSKELSPAAQAFLDFATSLEAASLIEAAGAVPVSK